MPVTTGNDTVSAFFDGIDLDGLGGDDLLIFSAPPTYLGNPVATFVFGENGSNNFTALTMPLSSDPWPEVLRVSSTIANFERFDVTAPLNVSAGFYTGNGNDTLRGANLDDRLSPGGGLNYVYGAGGNDTIDLQRGNGIDRVQGGNGNDTISNVGLDDVLDGGAGTDRLIVHLYAETSPVDLGMPDLYDNPNWTRFERIDIFLTDGDDVLRLNGLRGDVSGLGGVDLLILNCQGQSAVDIYPYLSEFTINSFDRLRFIGSAFNDRVYGMWGDDTLGGGAGNDTIFSIYGSDEVYGGSGNDVLFGVDLSDTVGGGAGFDIAVVDFSGATGAMILGHGYSPPNWSGIESYIGVLTRFDDTCYATMLNGNIGFLPDGRQALLDGGGGTDRLVLDYSRMGNGWAGVDIRLDQYGNGGLSQKLASGNGVIGCGLGGWEILDFTGSRYADFVQASDGTDILRGEGGNDTLFGGEGSNTLYGGNGDDNLVALPGGVTQAYGGAGTDLFSVSRLGQTIDGGRGEDTVDLDFGHVSFTTGVNLSPQGFESGRWSRVENVTGLLTSHDDTARLGFLGTGDSTLSGGAGHDTLILDYSAAGRALSASVSGTGFSIQMADGRTVDGQYADFEALNFTGTEGGDFASAAGMQARLIGLSGNDSLYGSDLDDLLDGGKGDDRLVGNFGNDLVQGGSGDDTIIGGNEINFAYGGDHDTLRGGDGQDIILGLNGHDLIEAGDGNDGVAGGFGNDHIFGGLGADLFYFEGDFDSGNDRIADYVEGSDEIWISGGMTLSNVTIADVDADKLVTWSAGSVLLQGMAGQAVQLFFDADFV